MNHVQLTPVQTVWKRYNFIPKLFFTSLRFPKSSLESNLSQPHCEPRSPSQHNTNATVHSVNTMMLQFAELLQRYTSPGEPFDTVDKLESSP